MAAKVTNLNNATNQNNVLLPDIEVNDKNYFGIIDDIYGKRFFKVGNGALVEGDVGIKISDTIRIEGLGDYSGVWETTGAMHTWTIDNFTTSFQARKIRNEAGKLLKPSTKKGDKFVVLEADSEVARLYGPVTR